MTQQQEYIRYLERQNSNLITLAILLFGLNLTLFFGGVYICPDQNVTSQQSHERSQSESE